MHTDAHRQGLGCQGSSAAISPASLGQECSLEGNTHTEILARVWNLFCLYYFQDAVALCQFGSREKGWGNSLQSFVSVLPGPHMEQDIVCHPGVDWHMAQASSAQKSDWVRQVT